MSGIPVPMWLDIVMLKKIACKYELQELGSWFKFGILNILVNLLMIVCCNLNPSRLFAGRQCLA